MSSGVYRADDEETGVTLFKVIDDFEEGERCLRVSLPAYDAENPDILLGREDAQRLRAFLDGWLGA